MPNFFIPGLLHDEIPLAAWLLKSTWGSVLIATLLDGTTNPFGFLKPGLDTANRWWLIAADRAGKVGFWVLVGRINENSSASL